MTSYVTPKKNIAYKFYVALVDQSNTKLTKANPTIAAGDFKVSTDGGAFANLATLPSANPASGRAVMIDLSTSEMNGDNIVVQCVDAAGAEWCDLVINIQTSARQIDDLAYPATSGRSMVVDASGLVDANAVKVGPTGSGTAQTAGDVGAGVAAVKVQTDKLTFTVANQIDANVLDWKSSAAPAMTGDAFGRLGAPAGASIAADIATRLATSGYTAPPTAAQNATAVLTTQMTESYAALHTVPTLAQIMFEMRGLQGGKSVATTFLTINKIDGSTPAEVFTLDSATVPTSINRTT